MIKLLCARLLLPAFILGLTVVVSAQSRAVASDDKLKVFLGRKLLLENDRDGFMAVHRIVYSPNGRNFVVIGCGFECTDNIGFLFRADGTRKRKFTARWDVIFDDKLEWSADGSKIYYFRINSTGADPPKTAPPEGWVAVDVATGRKGPAITRRLNECANYSVFNTGDGLAVRARPGVNAKEVGRLPSDAKGLRVTGPGRQIGRAVWVPIKHNALSGWVNQNFLFEEETVQAKNLDSIAGIEWVLRTWKTDEPAPASPAVTLKYENGKFAGRSGCNRYSSTVSEGPASGSLKVGPTISTRMACPEPAMAIENRFLKQLEAVTKFELPSDQLALTYELDGTVEVMVFEKK